MTMRCGQALNAALHEIFERDDRVYLLGEDLLDPYGGAFKITARSLDGVMVTILADNYYGYCKKEVKTQISFSANLYGLAEEEHAGGALAFATVSLGDGFVPDARFETYKREFGDRFEAIELDPATAAQGTGMNPHSVLTIHLDENDPEGPTKQAEKRVIEFFAQRLSPR